MQFVRAVQTVSASVAEPADRALLETGSRVAVLVVSGHTKLKGDRPAMVGSSRYRGDLYAITIQAERGAEAVKLLWIRTCSICLLFALTMSARVRTGLGVMAAQDFLPLRGRRRWRACEPERYCFRWP